MAKQDTHHVVPNPDGVKEEKDRKLVIILIPKLKRKELQEILAKNKARS